MKNRKSTVLFCFSPPVMIATFVIELSLLLYILIRYKMSPLTRLIAATLLLLALFQFAEYQVCESGGDTVKLASRLGFVAITLLPAVGIHIIYKILDRASRGVVELAYASALTFILIFGFSKSAFVGYACSGNYAIFQLTPKLGGIYFAYYYFWLLLGITMCLYFSIRAKLRTRQALMYQAFGYLVLLLPTGMVNALKPETIDGIPSVMCGFAIVYALVLVFGIAPVMLKSRK